MVFNGDKPSTLRTYQNYIPTSGAQGLGQDREGHWPRQWFPSTAIILAWWQREPLHGFPPELKHGGVTPAQPQEPAALEEWLLSKFDTWFFSALPHMMRAKGFVYGLMFFSTNFFTYLKCMSNIE